MGTVVSTLVLAVRAASARAHSLSASVTFFPQGTPSSRGRVSDHGFFALPRNQRDRTGEFEVGRRQTRVCSARGPAGLGLWGILRPPKDGWGRPPPG